MGDGGAVGLGIEGFYPDTVFRAGGQGIGLKAFGIRNQDGCSLFPVWGVLKGCGAEAGFRQLFKTNGTDNRFRGAFCRGGFTGISEYIRAGGIRLGFRGREHDRFRGGIIGIGCGVQAEEEEGSHQKKAEAGGQG